MSDLVQINLRAGAEQKARWEEYVEETGRFNSLSELIRASVEAEINDTGSAANETADPALTGDVQDIKDELSSVRKNVAWLREHAQGDVDIADFAQEVFDALEELPSVQDPIQVPDDVEMDNDEYQRYLRAEAVVNPTEADHRSPQTARALADRLDSTPDRVRDAIEYLEDQFLPVTAIDYDGERHYFREA